MQNEATQRLSNALSQADECLGFASAEIETRESLAQGRLANAEHEYRAAVASVHTSQTFQQTASQVEISKSTVKEANAQENEAHTQAKTAAEVHDEFYARFRDAAVLYEKAPANISVAFENAKAANTLSIEAAAYHGKCAAATLVAKVGYFEAMDTHRALIASQLDHIHASVTSDRVMNRDELQSLSLWREQAKTAHQHAHTQAYTQYSSDLEALLYEVQEKAKAVETTMKEMEQRHAIARANADTHHTVALANALGKVEQRHARAVSVALEDAEQRHRTNLQQAEKRVQLRQLHCELQPQTPSTELQELQQTRHNSLVLEMERRHASELASAIAAATEEAEIRWAVELQATKTRCAAEVADAVADFAAARERVEKNAANTIATATAAVEDHGQADDGGVVVMGAQTNPLASVASVVRRMWSD